MEQFWLFLSCIHDISGVRARLVHTTMHSSGTDVLLSGTRDGQNEAFDGHMPVLVGKGFCRAADTEREGGGVGWKRPAVSRSPLRLTTSRLVDVVNVFPPLFAQRSSLQLGTGWNFNLSGFGSGCGRTLLLTPLLFCRILMAH